MTPRLSLGGARRFGTVLEPEDAEPPILSAAVRAATLEWLTELSLEEELAALKLKPRRTALFEGPPGCGKTTLAHHVAARLGLPLLLVNMASVQSQWVHATGQNVRELFAGIADAEGQCILFLDEFDAIASKRTDARSSAAAEKNSIVIALLQQFDRERAIIIAATNQAANIDQALWRRFGLQLRIDLPDGDQRYAIIARYLAPLKLHQRTLEWLTDATANASPALLRGLMEGIKRHHLLAPRFNWKQDLRQILARILVTVQPPADWPGEIPLWAGLATPPADLPWPPWLTTE